MAIAGDPGSDPDRELSLDEIRALTDTVSIHALLKQLNQHEQRVDHELDELLDNRERLQTTMSSLVRLNPALQHLRTEAQQLESTIGFTCNLAENVSSKVRELDLAQNNVQQTIQYVQDIIDLRQCVDGVEEAMRRHDYEQAAQHIHRYLQFDAALLAEELDVGEDVARKGSTRARLEAAAEELRWITNKAMDDAVRDVDTKTIARYVKLFPLIGIEAAGLKKYSHYVCGRIAERAQSNLKQSLTAAGSDTSKIPFVNLLSMMFDDIARCVDAEAAFLEVHYGAGHALTLLQALQRECDRQAASILDSFVNSRRIHKLVTEVSTAGRAGRAKEPAHAEGGGVEARDLDGVLWEMATIVSRGEAFDAFMRQRAKAEHAALFAFAAEDGEDAAGATAGSTGAAGGPGPVYKRQASMTEEQVLARARRAAEVRERKERLEAELGKELLGGAVSGLNKRVQEIMGQYILLEQYFMAACVQKAVKLDYTDAEQIVSTMVDDVFFVLQKCTRRGLSTQHADCVCAVLNHANAILEEDFAQVLKKRLSGGLADLMASLLTGQGDLKEMFGQVQRKMDASSDDRAREYLVNLNNVETSQQYLTKLHDTILHEFDKVFAAQPERVRQKGATCLGDMLNTAKVFRQILDDGIEKLFAHRLYTLIYNAVAPMLNATYVLTDEELTYNDVNDPWAQEAVQGLNAMLAGLRAAMTDTSYDLCSRTFAAHLTTTVESFVPQLQFNQNGGIQLDKEVRLLVSSMTGATEWTVRDKFTRLTQMATLLSLERLDDVHEYWNSSMLTWRLTPAEVRKILGLRVDYVKDDVAKLAL